MLKSTNYLFLSVIFFVVYLVIEFTNIYGDSAWFKAFLLILCFTFLVSGISIKLKKNNKL